MSNKIIKSFATLTFVFFAFISHQILLAQSAEETQNPGDITLKFQTLNDNILSAMCTMRVSARPEHIWSALVDYNNFHHYIPGMLHSQLVKEEGNVKIVDQIAQSGFSILKLKARVRMQITEKPIETVSFKQLKGDLRLFKGSWQILEDTDANSCKVVYYSEMKPKIPLPHGIIRHLQERDLPEVMQAVRKRAEMISRQASASALADQNPS